MTDFILLLSDDRFSMKRKSMNGIKKRRRLPLPPPHWEDGSLLSIDPFLLTNIQKKITHINKDRHSYSILKTKAQLVPPVQRTSLTEASSETSSPLTLGTGSVLMDFFNRTIYGLINSSKRVRIRTRIDIALWLLEKMDS